MDNPDAALPEPRRIDRSKVEDYLLHPVNSRGKAAYFQAIGFAQPRWQVLRDAPLDHAQHGAVQEVTESAHGSRYLVLGTLCGPDGRDPPPVVCAVWQADNGLPGVRLITAYPA